MQSSGCALEGIKGCGKVGVFWRESVGVDQWVCSGGNQSVWTCRSQYALSEWDQCVWSSGCGLKETVDVFWRESVCVVQWVLWKSVGAFSR